MNELIFIGDFKNLLLYIQLDLQQMQLLLYFFNSWGLLFLSSKCLLRFALHLSIATKSKKNQQ